MSSYSLNPNVPQSHYTPAPVTRASTNVTPPAVAKPAPTPPASPKEESLVTPKNIAIGLGSIAGLVLLGLGIKSHIDDVARQLEHLKAKSDSLETEVAEKVDEISELKQKGTKKPAGDSFDDVDDLDDLDGDPKPAKEEGWFKWPFSGKAEKKKPLL